MSRPVVSIIIPVYNTVKYLSRCLNSVLVQTFADFECLVIDDGSVDNSGKICDDYAIKDSRIKVVHQEGKGVSFARNTALDMATGQWIVFVDSDDWIEQNLLEVAIKTAHEHSADIVQWNYIAEGGRPVASSEIFEDGYMEINSKTRFPWGFAMVWSRMYLKDLLDKYKIRFSTELIFAEDGPFTFNSVAVAHSIWCIKRNLYHYVCRSESSSHTLSKEQILSKISAAKLIEETLKKLNKSNQFKTAIFQKKVGARNSLLFDLKEPDLNLWRRTFPETNLWLLLNNKIKSVILYICIFLHLDFLIVHCIKMKRKNRR